MRAARSDERAARLLAADAEQENDVVGFHAPRAIEKALKAVLVASGSEIPYSHDLAFLLDVAGRHTTTTPASVARSDWLTPWAVAARYGVSDASLDRGAVVAVAEEAVSWAMETVEAG